jgi:hypothetical protein
LAQATVQISREVDASFTKEFSNAVYTQWTQLGEIAMARFVNEKENCIAYFGSDGKLVLSGREISFEIVPSGVRKATENLKVANLKKHGHLQISKVYEVSDDYETMYYLNLQGPASIVSVLVHGNGHSKILKESPMMPTQSEPLIALMGIR